VQFRATAANGSACPLSIPSCRMGRSRAEAPASVLGQAHPHFVSGASLTQFGPLATEGKEVVDPAPQGRNKEGMWHIVTRTSKAMRAPGFTRWLWHRDHIHPDLPRASPSCRCRDPADVTADRPSLADRWPHSPPSMRVHAVPRSRDAHGVAARKGRQVGAAPLEWALLSERIRWTRPEANGPDQGDLS
jgi:hypothetical protein